MFQNYARPILQGTWKENKTKARMYTSKKSSLCIYSSVTTNLFVLLTGIKIVIYPSESKINAVQDCSRLFMKFDDAPHRGPSRRRPLLR